MQRPMLHYAARLACEIVRGEKPPPFRLPSFTSASTTVLPYIPYSYINISYRTSTLAGCGVWERFTYTFVDYEYSTIV